jgi:hypothetical protein
MRSSSPLTVICQPVVSIYHAAFFDLTDITLGDTFQLKWGKRVRLCLKAPQNRIEIKPVQMNTRSSSPKNEQARHSSVCGCGKGGLFDVRLIPGGAGRRANYRADGGNGQMGSNRIRSSEVQQIRCRRNREIRRAKKILDWCPALYD